jgi:hypothetical protein
VRQFTLGIPLVIVLQQGGALCFVMGFAVHVRFLAGAKIPQLRYRSVDWCYVKREHCTLMKSDIVTAVIALLFFTSMGVGTYFVLKLRFPFRARKR